MNFTRLFGLVSLFSFLISGSAAELAGPIDILINNASTLGPVPLRLLNDTECEELGEVLEANLLAPFRLTKAVTGEDISMNVFALPWLELSVVVPLIGGHLDDVCNLRGERELER